MTNSYKDTINWMFSRLPSYQKIGKKAFKNKLDNIIKFCEKLGNPHRKIKTIHIAGTNGKGSTSHMMASVLQENGYRVGLYTSPHLLDFRERIKINGQDIPKKKVVDFITQNTEFLKSENLSFFEMTVAMAFDYFANENVDIAVIETGLGGALDSTNIITPEISIITNIGKDHTDILGNTFAEIATQKAGITKPKTPVIIGEYIDETLFVFEKKATENNSEIILVNQENDTDYKSDLKGFYQTKNINTVVKSIEILNNLGWNISDNSIKKGLLNVIKNTKILGRWQIFDNNPKIICDTGHNLHAIKHIAKQLKFELKTRDELHIILGFVKGKDFEKIINSLPQKSFFYFCKPSINRGLDTSFMKNVLPDKSNFNYFDDVKSALKSAKTKSQENDLIFVGGSTFVVADFLEIMQ